MTHDLPQGDVRLLGTATAQELLGAAVPARLAWSARDGSPRVTPTYFLWDGSELVMSTYAAAHKLKDLAVRPRVAITIDTDPPPRVLLVRGDAGLTYVDGVAPEYEATLARYLGADAAAAAIAEVDRPGLRMARIAVRPQWVGVLDFVERLPDALRVEQATVPDG